MTNNNEVHNVVKSSHGRSSVNGFLVVPSGKLLIFLPDNWFELAAGWKQHPDICAETTA